MHQEISEKATVNDFFSIVITTERFLNKDYREQQRYITAYNKYVHDTPFGMSPVSGLTPSCICRLFNSIPVPASVLLMRTILKDIIFFASEYGLLSGNPMKPIHFQWNDDGTLNCIRVLTDDEIPVFLFHVECDPMKNCFYLSLFEGLRLGECLGLRWQDVDFERKTISVCVHQKVIGNPDGTEYVLADATKNGKQRLIYITPVVYNILLDEKQREERKQSGSMGRYKNEFNLVFTDELGNPFHPERLKNTVYRISKIMGIEGFSFHGLRRTFATQCIISGADISTVQQMLDHFRADLTLKYYITCTEDMKHSAADKLEAVISEFFPQEKSLV